MHCGEAEEGHTSNVVGAFVARVDEAFANQGAPDEDLAAVAQL